MNNNISNMDQYQIDYYTDELKKAVKHYSAGLALMRFAMVVTLILYGLFTIHLYLGNGLSWGEYFKTVNGTAWFWTMLSIAALLSIFLAWVKHFAYTHFSKFAPMTGVVFTVIAFALFAEFFSSSANQYAKSHAMLSTDSAYQATVKQQPPTITTNSHLSDQIAKAEQRLARCEHNLKRGKEKHCRGDSAKLRSLKESQVISVQVQLDSNVAMQKQNYDRQDKLKADSHNPTIVAVSKLLSTVFGGTYADWIKTAIVLVMLIVAVSFEKLHHFLSGALKESDFAVQHNKRKLAELNDQNDSSWNVKADSEDSNNSGFGFMGATAKAEHQPTESRFKYQSEDIQKQPMGFVNTDGDNSRPIPKKSSAKTSTMDRQNDLFNDTAQTLPNNTAQNTTNNTAQTLPNTASSDKGQAVLDTGSEKQDEIKGAGLLFPDWKRAVLNNYCKPTITGSRNWIRQRIKEGDSVVHKSSREYVSNIVDRLFTRAIKEGFMHENKEWTQGMRNKYFLTRL